MIMHVWFADQRKWGGVGSPPFIHPLWAAPVCGGGRQVHADSRSRTNDGTKSPAVMEMKELIC